MMLPSMREQIVSVGRRGRRRRVFVSVAVLTFAVALIAAVFGLIVGGLFGLLLAFALATAGGVTER